MGLLNQHPEINYVGHRSIPSGANTYYPFHNIFNQKRPPIDKILIIVRDKHCVNKSNEKQHGKNDICEKATDFIKNEINKLPKEKHKDVVFTSYEMLFQYKELTLRQIFRQFGLNDDNYNYNNDDVSFDGGWYKTKLCVHDINGKYIKD